MQNTAARYSTALSRTPHPAARTSQATARLAPPAVYIRLPWRAGCHTPLRPPSAVRGCKAHTLRSRLRRKTAAPRQYTVPSLGKYRQTHALPVRVTFTNFETQ
ncbi:hypothetical protein NPIL_46081 [Nephila pilipes]|uniref:Uncharacterized protein n=1 Tax=Nephila pilipes TaxID=299642 RepID=A0A8X6PFJ0_NEPPI|nr:hypothetical protein NPIL_46081 [Nephila pilipes]